MCWDYAGTKKKAEAFNSLTASQRLALTWDEARKYVPVDTLCMASWRGAEAKKTTSPAAVLERMLPLHNDRSER